MDKVKVGIDGLNLSKIINLLVQNNICVTDIKIKNGRLTFFAQKQDFEKIAKICQINNKSISILSNYSIINFIKNFKYKLGFVLAFFLSFAYLFSFNNVIMNLKIKNAGEVVYDLSKVKNLLSSNGVSGGKFINFSSKEIEDILINNLDDIYGCSVLKVGSNLEILIYPEIKNNDVKKEMVSKFDAVITELEIYSGSSKFNVGDIVKRGDVLIFDDSQASGKIKGKVYFSGYEIFNERRQKIKYTGNYFSNKTISLFAKNLYKQSKNNNYSQYLTKKCDFYINNNFFLPVVCSEEFVFEVEIFEEILDFKDYEEEIKERLFLSIKNDCGFDVEKSAVTYSVVREGDLVRVDCFVEVEVDLC